MTPWWLRRIFSAVRRWRETRQWRADLAAQRAILDSMTEDRRPDA